MQVTQSHGTAIHENVLAKRTAICIQSVRLLRCDDSADSKQHMYIIELRKNRSHIAHVD